MFPAIQFERHSQCAVNAIQSQTVRARIDDASVVGFEAAEDVRRISIGREKRRAKQYAAKKKCSRTSREEQDVAAGDRIKHRSPKMIDRD